MAISVNPSVIALVGMEIGGGPIAGFGSAPAERVTGSEVESPHRRSLLVFHGLSLLHLRSDYCDPCESFVCCRDLRCGSLLRNFVDPALVASEDFRLGTLGERGDVVAFKGEKSPLHSLTKFTLCFPW
jgi:hypothetical protein